MSEARVVEIDLDDPTPPYAQLRRRLAAMIDSGVFAAGERLPSVRQLAGDLGIAPGTVMRAYKELESSGHVRGDRRRGTVVAGRREGAAVPTETLLDLAATYCREAALLGADAEQTSSAVERVLDQQRQE